MTPQGKMAQCQICEHTERLQALKEQGSFFIILDFHKQLSFLIEKTKSELESSLVKARLPASKISDITNARCYAKLKKARSLADDDLTLTINTDGSPVFKSSKTSVWPIQFIVNELPPHLRFKHPVLAGLWFGESHPNMQLFLDKFVQEVNSTKPVTWTYQNRVHTSMPFVLCCSVDAPARAAVLNMVPFNGYFGCPWCLIRGEHVEGSMRYVTDEPVEARTSDLVRRDMKMALDYKDVINSVRGPSALMNLKGLDLVNGQNVEYMHCVLQGVSKQLTEAILTSTNSNQRFYVGQQHLWTGGLINRGPSEVRARSPERATRLYRWAASDGLRATELRSCLCLARGLVMRSYNFCALGSLVLPQSRRQSHEPPTKLLSPHPCHCLPKPPPMHPACYRKFLPHQYQCAGKTIFSVVTYCFGYELLS
ncbi:uncharacterized protein [Dermacentor andersoni]|uniref:uncharacterized protein n=1 Tax=Dermacentor andersoni TaxID=34620 RepID=UPI003B3A4B24